MQDIVELFSARFMPHGHCYSWTPEILWLHVGSDSLVAASYFTIPVALVYFIRRRRDLRIRWIFYMFGLFIFSCGATHAMAVYNTWHGAYASEGLVKLATAGVSMATAVAVWPLIPRLLALPGVDDLRHANEALREEVEGRRRAEVGLRELTETLEQRVEERTRELERINHELERFTYVVSHDLRAPLVNVKGFSGELDHAFTELRSHAARVRQHLDEPDRASLDRLLDGEIPESLGYVSSSVDRMDRMVSAILRLARAGHRELVEEPLDLRALVDDIVDSLSHQLQERDARVEVGELPPLRSDGFAVEQVLGNLLSNAVRYLHPERPGRIAVRGRPREDGPGVVVEVADNGRGIAPEDQERIFEAFRRAAPLGEGGEGIGLSAVRGHVRRLGGEVTCRSTPGEGSVFTVVLPHGVPSGRQRTERGGAA